jgi:hypothetical protein
LLILYKPLRQAFEFCQVRELYKEHLLVLFIWYLTCLKLYINSFFLKYFNFLLHVFIRLEKFKQIFFSNWKCLFISAVNNINYCVCDIANHVPIWNWSELTWTIINKNRFQTWWNILNLKSCSWKNIILLVYIWIY